MADLKDIFFTVLVIATNLRLAVTWGTNSDDAIGIRAGDPVTYTGGVLEYEPYSDWKHGGEGVARENARIITQYAADAKAQGVDILVSPEYGIQSLNDHELYPKEFFSLMQYVPDPGLGTVPCTVAIDPPNVVAVQTLSCSAMENEMYLVVDMGEASPCSPDVRNPFNNTLDLSSECPHSGYIYYNTQVVFDRDGTVVARYRKKNLFWEQVFTSGTEPNEDATFTADFGVTFTLHICFDIAYFNPSVSNIGKYGIQDVIMSTAWIDILPYYLAPAIQNSWSRGLGVNLMVSGYHEPEIGKMGSGIYRGASDLAFNYIYDTESGSQLLVSEVHSVASADVKVSDASRLKTTSFDKALNVKKAPGSLTVKADLRRDHRIVYDDLSNYTQVLLEQGESEEIQHAEACHSDGLCCWLSYYPTGSLNYSLVAFSGPVVPGIVETHIYAQVCSILWCRTEDVRSCTHIDEGLPESDSFKAFTLTGNFTTEYVYPSAFERNFAVTDNDLYSITVQNQHEVTMSSDGPTKDLMTAGLYGRWYAQDP